MTDLTGKKTVQHFYENNLASNVGSFNAVNLASENAESVYTLPDFDNAGFYSININTASVNLQETLYGPIVSCIDTTGYETVGFDYPIGDLLNLYDKTTAQALNSQTSDSKGYEIPNLSSYAQGNVIPASLSWAPT